MRRRHEWQMPGPLGPPMALPASTLVVHHSVTAFVNGDQAVRDVAQIGIDRFGRASYSYAVVPHGTVYEMQGGQVGAHVAGHNSTTFGVVLLGNYEHNVPTSAQLIAVAGLHQTLTAQGALVQGAPVVGHRDMPGAATACPGRHLYADLATIRKLIAVPPPPEPVDPEADLMLTPILIRGREPRLYAFSAAGGTLFHIPQPAHRDQLVATGQLRDVPAVTITEPSLRLYLPGDVVDRALA